MSEPKPPPGYKPPTSAEELLAECKVFSVTRSADADVFSGLTQSGWSHATNAPLCVKPFEVTTFDSIEQAFWNSLDEASGVTIDDLSVGPLPPDSWQREHWSAYSTKKKESLLHLKRFVEAVKRHENYAGCPILLSFQGVSIYSIALLIYQQMLLRVLDARIRFFLTDGHVVQGDRGGLSIGPDGYRNCEWFVNAIVEYRAQSRHGPAVHLGIRMQE